MSSKLADIRGVTRMRQCSFLISVQSVPRLSHFPPVQACLVLLLLTRTWVQLQAARPLPGEEIPTTATPRLAMEVELTRAGAEFPPFRPCSQGWGAGLIDYGMVQTELLYTIGNKKDCVTRNSLYCSGMELNLQYLQGMLLLKQ